MRPRDISGHCLEGGENEAVVFINSEFVTDVRISVDKLLTGELPLERVCQLLSTV